ncbi:MAG: 5-oxoprolinase subunit PxpA [Paraburkholderia sp.]|jgi:UPF0271 protein|uniref:LamB/YcsF family protein n=1 Tax=Burkholderiaceae TaxID=119060 RepID=UPI0010F7CA2F|nr:5-oxoprolinase subunit PxpA [Burkholderia sp. 4M9327F10]
MQINLNADIGEGFGKYRVGHDAALMPLIGSANIACGMHAGDPSIMVETVKLALGSGVSLGAHPGFNDLWGFGRRQIFMSARDLEYLVTYQIGALQAIARSNGGAVTHVKPHGALNNMAHDDIEYALAIGRGIKAADPDLIYVANAGSQMVRAAYQVDLRVAMESYVDRVYDDNGKMLSRDRPNAVIKDPLKAAEHVIRIIEEEAIISESGKKIPARIDTFCVHGDEPTAVAVVIELHEALRRAGISVVTLPELLA